MFGGLNITDISAFENALGSLEYYCKEVNNRLGKNEELLMELEKHWISETEDEQTYFSNSYKNIEDTKKVIEACNRIKNVLTDYIEKLKKLSNEEV